MASEPVPAVSPARVVGRQAAKLSSTEGSAPITPVCAALLGHETYPPSVTAISRRIHPLAS
jgi:hypothetical protein